MDSRPRVRSGSRALRAIGHRPAGGRIDGSPAQLPDGTAISSHLIVETKDEHDWERTGKEFAQFALKDLAMIGDGRTIPARSKGVKLSMLREEHFEVAREAFGTDDLNRLFVVHALHPEMRHEIAERMRSIRAKLLDDHPEHCVRDALASGGSDASAEVAEASAAITRLVRS